MHGGTAGSASVNQASWVSRPQDYAQPNSRMFIGWIFPTWLSAAFSLKQRLRKEIACGLLTLNVRARPAVTRRPLGNGLDNAAHDLAPETIPQARAQRPIARSSSCRNGPFPPESAERIRLRRK